MKVAHLTTVHPYSDTRILERECVTLAETGIDVVLLAPGDVSLSHHGVQVIGIHRPRFISVLSKAVSSNRLLRLPVDFLAAMVAVRKVRPDVVHAHDPELLLLLPILRLWSRVVFDAHEDYGRQLSSKPHLGRLGPFLGRISDLLLNLVSRLASGVVVAHTWQYPSLPRRHVVRNFPKAVPFEQSDSKRSAGPLRLAYVGRIDRSRGAITMLELLQIGRRQGFDVSLELVGRLTDSLLAEMEAHPSWPDVNFHGPLSWGSAMAEIKACDIGLFLPEPTPAYERSEATKVYEYLSLGLLPVTTGMAVYRAIQAEAPDALHILEEIDDDAVTELLSNESRFGSAARTARMNWALSNASWQSESKQLIRLYETLEKNE